MPLRERQEIQEVLRCLSAWQVNPGPHLSRWHPHTTAYPSAPSQLNLRNTVRQEGNNRGRLHYVRQSTPGRVEHNRESTARQYAMAERACQLGWPKEQVVIVD
jgi:hypothetical protein